MNKFNKGNDSLWKQVENDVYSDCLGKKHSSINSFTAEICHPLTETVVSCEIGYQIRDVGTTTSKLSPVICWVITPDGENILDLLETEGQYLKALVKDAQTDYEDSRAFSRVGVEEI